MHLNVLKLQANSYYSFYNYTRAVISDAGNGITQLHQETHYFPFGLEMPTLSKNYTTPADENRYSFNGKEKLVMKGEDNDLFWYDYGARFYDPQIGRWHSIDPKAELNRKWSPYRYAYDNPLRFIDPDGMTEEERVKAAERMKEHESKGTKYEKGSGDSNVKPGGKSDCSGTVGESIKNAGEVNPNIYNPEKPNQRGVQNMVDNMQKVEDVANVEVGLAVVTHNSTHVGLVTAVNKDDEGNVVSFNVTHNEIAWETKNKDGKVIASGGGKVHTDVIRVDYIGKTRAEKATNMEQKFVGLYKWDDIN